MRSAGARVEAPDAAMLRGDGIGVSSHFNL